MVGTVLAMKICEYFNISMDYLMNGEVASITVDPEIKPISERDIARKLEEVIGDIYDKNTSPLYYNGEKIDDKSLAILALTLENAMKQVEIMREKKKK